MVKSFNTTVLDLHVLYWRHTIHRSALYVPYFLQNMVNMSLFYLLRVSPLPYCPLTKTNITISDRLIRVF